MAKPRRAPRQQQPNIPGADNTNFRPLRVITGSDRSDLLRPDQTRNVQVQKKRTQASTIPDTATNFSQTYKQAGIQPSNLDERPAGSRQESATAIDQLTQTKQSAPMVQSGVKTQKQRIKIRKKSKAKAAFAKARVTAANIGVLSWAVPTWFFFQVPFAIFSTIMMAFAQAIYEFIEKLEVPSEEERTIVEGAFETIIDILTWISTKVLEFFDINLKLFNPDQVYLLTAVIVSAVGITTIFTMFIIYKLALLNPLSGEKAGLKYIMFFITFLGYTVGALVPVANLIPWFLGWMFVVWIYPK